MCSHIESLSPYGIPHGALFQEKYRWWPGNEPQQSAILHAALLKDCFVGKEVVDFRKDSKGGYYLVLYKTAQ